MKTWPLRDEEGRQSGFEICNAFISRNDVVKTLQSLPGCSITRGARYSERRDDQFCQFRFEGAKFTALETWGDSSQYWIGAEDVAGYSSLARIEAAFNRRPAWSARGLLPWIFMLLFSVILVYNGLRK